MKKSRLLVAASTFLLCLSVDTNAAPVFYANDEAGFQTALGSNTLSLESFESGFTNGTLVSFPGFTVSTPDGEIILSIANGAGATDGTDTMGIVDNGFDGNQLVFNFDNPINAFAIDIHGALNVGGPGTLTLSNENGASGFILTESNTTGVNDVFDFGGLIDSAQSFSTVTLTASQTGDGIQFDKLQFGAISAVPVPAAAWLFGSGLLWLAGISRRKTAKY
jgi:hypothetical protein